MFDFIEDFKGYDFENFGMVRLPEVRIPEDVLKKNNLPLDISHKNFLLELARVGFKEKRAKLAPERIKEYGERIKNEIELFDELGFIDYVTLVWLVYNKAWEMGAYTDFGRGSCAGSLLFYLLGITKVDPIDKSLFFERFVSKVRAKKKVIDGVTYLQGDLIADVDINLGGVRPQIIEWLMQEYKGKMSKILALGTFTGKILLKDVYKVVEEVSEDEAKRVADMVEKHAGIVENIEKMPDKSEQFKKWALQHPKVFSIALKLRDLLRQKSSHASGYLLSFYDLDGFVPLELNKEKELVAGYDMGQVCNFAVKLDLLGLISNEIIQDISKSISEKIDDIELDNNPIVYDQFQNGQLLPYGLYQISADTAYKVVNKVKPKNISELSDVNAIARPGALAYLDGYVAGNAESPHEVFSSILGETRNFCLYQEQMMKMATAIGFSLDESEILRRVVGKKKIHEVQEWKEKIYKKCEENGFSTNIGDILWKILDDSSKYSFNKCLSLDTVIETKTGDKLLYEIVIGDEIKAFDTQLKIDHYVTVTDKIKGTAELYEVELEDGRKIKCSMQHKFLTQNNGMQTLADIIKYKYKIITD